MASALHGITRTDADVVDSRGVKALADFLKLFDVRGRCLAGARARDRSFELIGFRVCVAGRPFEKLDPPAVRVGPEVAGLRVELAGLVNSSRDLAVVLGKL